jgi:hypothetical protein
MIRLATWSARSSPLAWADGTPATRRVCGDLAGAVLMSRVPDRRAQQMAGAA